MDPRDVLKNIYLFRDATPQDLAAVAAIAEEKVYIGGEYIYRPNEIPDALYVVESGTIDITIKDKDLPLASVASGQSLGELAFFDRGARAASAVAREATHVLRLPFAKLDQVFAEHPALATEFYRRACVFLAQLLRTIAPDLNSRYF